MEKYTHKSRYFYGNKISQYGLDHGFVDYRTLAKSFDAILNNNILSATQNMGYIWDVVNGSEVRYYDNETGDYIDWDEIDDGENVTEEFIEIFQFYIISDRGAEILQELTNEIVFYNEALDVYLWGVTHWGTSWDYVLTNIPVVLEEEAQA